MWSLSVCECSKEGKEGTVGVVIVCVRVFQGGDCGCGHCLCASVPRRVRRGLWVWSLFVCECSKEGKEGTVGVVIVCVVIVCVRVFQGG